MNIKQLEKYLDSLRSGWSELEEENLGNFDDQEVFMITAKGMAHARVRYYGEFGVVVEVDDSHRSVVYYAQ